MHHTHHGETALVGLTTEGPIATLTIKRPQALNALNKQVLLELFSHVHSLHTNNNIHAVILTGDGKKAFVAGADISEMRDMQQQEAENFGRLGHRVFKAVEELPMPVLAAVNGFALGGGCELALACDMIYASSNAKFGLPEVKLGLIPGFGGTVRLARKIGALRASELIYTADIIDAQKARDYGLVLEVFPEDELITKVTSLAKTITSRAPLAVRAAKRSLVHGMATDAKAAAILEQAVFAGLFGSQDTKEGLNAFIEKRDAKFLGR